MKKSKEMKNSEIKKLLLKQQKLGDVFFIKSGITLEQYQSYRQPTGFEIEHWDQSSLMILPTNSPNAVLKGVGYNVSNKLDRKQLKYVIPKDPVMKLQRVDIENNRRRLIAFVNVTELLRNKRITEEQYDNILRMYTYEEVTRNMMEALLTEYYKKWYDQL